MRTCNTTVTTPTGVFTYYDAEVTYCQAKVECARRGQILAPVTNRGDLDALLSVANDKDPNCKFHYGYIDYFIGLDVSICGGEQTRLFTNNQQWNETEHGQLYKWVGSETKDVNVAVYNPYFRKLFIAKSLYKHKGHKFRFICLKPNSTSLLNSEPLSALRVEELGSYSNLSVFLMVALLGVVLFLFIAKKKKENENSDLKKEIELLKRQNY